MDIRKGNQFNTGAVREAKRLGRSWIWGVCIWEVSQAVRAWESLTGDMEAQN